MAREGYWAVCEEFALPTVQGKPPASLTMISVRSFFYADSMGNTRADALRRVQAKLKDNINFYLACGQELPPFNFSDIVPRDYHSKENTSLIFISLADIGMEYLVDEQARRAASA